MTIGVYEIIAPDGCRYIGSSVRSVENRLSYHWARLASGQHYSAGLQEAYDKHGREGLRVKITTCREPRVAEQKKLDYWRARGKAFNVQPRADSPAGTRRTKEQKQRSSESAKARCSPEWRAAVSERVKRQHAEGRFGYDPNTAKKRTKWDRSKPHGLAGRKQSTEHVRAAQEAKTRKHNERYRKSLEEKEKYQ